jgi:uncharacterized protein (DUF1501 family)
MNFRSIRDELNGLDEPTRRAFALDLARKLLGVSILPTFGAFAPSAFGAEPQAKAASGKGAVDSGYDPNRAQHLIYLSMNGAMSQIDTFDPKPASKYQGETPVIETRIPGVKFGGSLPKLAALADKLAVVRGMTTTTADHGQAQYLIKTNYKPIATTRHPGLGPWLHKLAGPISQELPPSVVVGGGSNIGAGYLGAMYAPVPISDPARGLQNTTMPRYLKPGQFERRIALSQEFDREFRKKSKATMLADYDELYRSAMALLKSKGLTAFEIAKEKPEVQEAYGKNGFGQGVLLARRLVESGVRFVEVNLGGWDMHNDIFAAMPGRGATLDQAVSALLLDLETRGLLKKTLVVIGTEFGRKTPLSQNAGRDHHPAAFSCVLAGGSVKTGLVHGRTDEDAMTVEDDAVKVADFNATIAAALGLPLERQIFSPDGRPFTIANKGKPIKAILA